MATQLNAGFLGAILAGFLAGYVVLLIKKTIKLPKTLQGIMPVLIIPVVGSLVVGLVFFYVIGTPVAAINTAMNNFSRRNERNKCSGIGVSYWFDDGV